MSDAREYTWREKKMQEIKAGMMSMGDKAKQSAIKTIKEQTKPVKKKKNADPFDFGFDW